VGVYVSIDNGATWFLATPNSGVVNVPLVFDASGTGNAASVDLSFEIPPGAGHVKVQLRAASVAAGVTTVSLAASLIEVKRP
jgi:hypothetical protein